MPDKILASIEGFNVRIVHKGEAYGRNDCLTHENAMPMVEFYDASMDKRFGARGQFVSRYYCDTFLAIEENKGLDLMGGIPEWKISQETVKAVQNLILSNVNHDRLSTPHVA